MARDYAQEVSELSATLSSIEQVLDLPKLQKEFTELEAEVVDKTSLTAGKKNKTASQRFRAVLYRCWEQSQLNIDFEQYYAVEMEKVIEHYKSKLD